MNSLILTIFVFSVISSTISDVGSSLLTETRSSNQDAIKNPINVLNQFLPEIRVRRQVRNQASCKEGEYSCRGGLYCVEKRRLCDGVPECPYKDDEDECPQKCSSGWYQCHGTPVCIPLSLVCNKAKECPEGDDENEQSCSAENGTRLDGNRSDEPATVDYAAIYRKNKTSMNTENDRTKADYSNSGSGIYFNNFAPIFNGNSNVNGNENGNGNGNGNGNPGQD